MKNYLVLCTIFFCFKANAQEIKDKVKQFSQKVEDKFTGDTSAEPNYLIYPTFAYTPETRWEFGLINLLLFYAKNNKNNRLSEFNTFSFITQKGQYGLWLEHAIYTNKDKFFFLGNAKFQYFPLKYYGIGNNTNTNNYAIVEATNISLRERVLKKINRNIFGGIQFDYNQLSNVNFSNNIKLNEQMVKGINGSFSNGFGLTLVYDERKNILNERNSTFAEIGFINYSNIMGSTYEFNKIYMDARRFVPGFGKNQVLAFQAVGQFSTGSVPFNMYSLMGGENIMRGYYLGRYRDNHLLAVQAEYRFLPFSFSKRLGAAFFASAGSVQPKIKQYNLNDIKPAGGAGIRYLIFSSKDIFIRFDIAFTKESSGYYLFIGEAF